MILLDTHIWVWWIHGDENLTSNHFALISDNEEESIGVSTITCWEVAKLVEYGRLELPVPMKEWFEEALGYPGISLLPLSPEIAIESTQLPGEFHRDPADQIIVATARIHDITLVTVDSKIVDYPHVDTA